MATKKKSYKKPEVKSEVQPQPEVMKPQTAIIPTAEVVHKMEEVKKVSNIVARARLFKVVVQEDAIEAGRLLQELKVHAKGLKAARDFLVKPLKEHVTRLEALFKPSQQALDSAEVDLKAQVLAFTTKQAAEVKARELKLLAQADKAQRAGDNDRAVQLAEQAVNQERMQKTTHLEGGGFIQQKEVDAFEVEDLGEVPHEYFTLDESKIRKAIAAGVTSIPGVRIFKKPQLAVRTGS